MKNLVSIVLIFSLIWWLIRGKKETTETSSEKYVSTGLLSSVFTSQSIVPSSQTVSSPSSVTSSTSSSDSSSSSTGSSDSSSSSGQSDGSNGNIGTHRPADITASFSNKSKSKSAFV